MEEVDGGEEASTSLQVVFLSWANGQVLDRCTSMMEHSAPTAATRPASKKDGGCGNNEQRSNRASSCTQAQLFTALSSATAAALQACFLSTGEASKSGNAGQGAPGEQSLTLPVFLAVGPHRIYSALNALGLYNKNAKILFLVSSGVGLLGPAAAGVVGSRGRWLLTKLACCFVLCRAWTMRARPP